MSKLIKEIAEYYDKRGLVWPDTYEAMAFAHTEMAEAYEIMLARGDFVRNNPEDKPSYDGEAMATELADAVMMLIVAGMVNGYDVPDLLREKMREKCRI